MKPKRLRANVPVVNGYSGRAPDGGLPALDHVFITAGTLVLDAKLAPDTSTLAPAMDMRFWGALYAAKYAAPKIRPGGSITPPSDQP